MQRVAVTVPHGAAGGHTLTVQTPSGLMNVQVPQGLQPGQTFEMLVPVQQAQPSYAAPPSMPMAAPAPPPPPQPWPGDNETGTKPEYNELELTIVEAKRVRNADSSGLFKKGISDPYCVIKDVKGLIGDGGKTRTVKDSLDPVWNQTYHFKFNYKLSSLKFKLFDEDNGIASSLDGDDKLGSAEVQIAKLLHGAQPDEPITLDTWLPLRKPGPGELHIKAKIRANIPMATPGRRVPLPPRFRIGLAWEFKKKQPPLDLDASIVGLDAYENIMDIVSYKQLRGFHGAVVHSGDDRTGDGGGDDESIAIDAAALPPQVEKLALVINSFTAHPISSIKYAYVRLVVGGSTLAFYGIDKLSVPEGCTGLFVGVVQRAAGGRWEFVTTAVRADGRTVRESLPAVWHYGKANLGW